MHRRCSKREVRMQSTNQAAGHPHRSGENTATRIEATKEKTPGALLTAAQAAQALRISERTFHKLRREAWMPRPVMLGPRLLRWYRTEIEAAWPGAPRQQEPLPMPANLKSGQAAKRQRATAQ